MILSAGFEYKDLACSPSMSALDNRESPCVNNLCMRMIEAGEVLDKACELLDTRLPLVGRRL